MSYSLINAELQSRAANFATDVFSYLKKTGRQDVGRSYFGTLAANNPNLVSRLERGRPPSLEVMLRVWEYMEANPPKCDDTVGPTVCDPEDALPVGDAIAERAASKTSSSTRR
jgi:hypothetical protein